MSLSVPAIYAPRAAPVRLTTGNRLIALLVLVGCATMLGVAVRLTPSSAGVGTHEELGLTSCQFLYRTGLPCPSCGMTTSVSHFVRGNIAASIYVQPMGAMIAFATVAAFWVALYMVVTGRPALRLMQIIPARYYVVPLLTLAVAAWGWKIWIHARGIDGWH
jgi:hypothetical protein